VNEAAARAILESVSYKDGHQFVISPSGVGAYVLVLFQVNIPNSQDSSKRVNLRFTGTPFHRDELDAWKVEDLLREVRATVARLEIHEMHEWLRFEGKLLMDPHDISGIRRSDYALNGALFDPLTVDGA
jgi:hypothetical protein